VYVCVLYYSSVEEGGARERERERERERNKNLVLFSVPIGQNDVTAPYVKKVVTGFFFLSYFLGGEGGGEREKYG